MVKALLQWTFEIVHAWHIKTFEFAKQHCDELIIALNSDDLVRSYKHREPIDSRDNKKKVIESLRMVDSVIPATNESPRQLLLDNSIDVYIVWDEFLEKHKDLIHELREQWKKVVVVPRWNGCTSTSNIKQKLLEEALLVQSKHGTTTTIPSNS